jgi:hypothetical protein
MTSKYEGDQWLNMSQISRLTGHTHYMIDRAVTELGIQPTISPGAINQKRFSPAQVNQIIAKIDEIIENKR